MPLTPFQKAGFRHHRHSDDQIKDSETGETIGQGGEHPDLPAHKTLGLIGLSDVPAHPTLAAHKTLGLAAGAAMGVRALVSGSQSCANGNQEVVVWTTESFDTDNLKAATSNYLITVPTGGAGKWLVYFSLTFVGNATGTRRAEILKNNLTVSNYFIQLVGAAATNQPAIMRMDVITLADGDTLGVQVLQDSGGALVLSTGFGTAMRLGS